MLLDMYCLSFEASHRLYLAKGGLETIKICFQVLYFFKIVRFVA